MASYFPAVGVWVNWNAIAVEMPRWFLLGGESSACALNRRPQIADNSRQLSYRLLIMRAGDLTFAPPTWRSCAWRRSCRSIHANQFMPVKACQSIRASDPMYLTIAVPLQGRRQPREPAMCIARSSANGLVPALTQISREFLLHRSREKDSGLERITASVARPRVPYAALVKILRPIRRQQPGTALRAFVLIVCNQARPRRGLGL